VPFEPKKPVPVFPLPDVVLFPRVLLPLHVFELRYRTMVREALSAERLLALALLEPGWEGDYHGNPEFFPLATLARFEDVEWLPNDCYDIQVLGLSRVRIGTVVRDFPYRAARIEVLPQEPYTEDDPLVAIERGALVDAFDRWVGQRAREFEVPAPESPRGLTYEALVNHCCMAVDLPAREKLELLRMDSILERGHHVRELLERHLQRAQPRARPGDPSAGERN
jgi:Lon protease-like protein